MDASARGTVAVVTHRIKLLANPEKEKRSLAAVSLATRCILVRNSQNVKKVIRESNRLPSSDLDFACEHMANATVAREKLLGTKTMKPDLIELLARRGACLAFGSLGILAIHEIEAICSALIPWALGHEDPLKLGKK